MGKKVDFCAFCKAQKVIKFGRTWICTKCAGKLYRNKKGLINSALGPS